MQRKQPAPDLSLLAAVAILVLVAAFLALTYDRLFGPNPTVAIMGLGPAPTPTPLTADAERVVQKMYDAMTSGVETDYIDAIAPASREKIRLENIARGLLEHVQFDWYGAHLAVEDLTGVEYRKMRYTGELLASDHVVVTAAGGIWIDTMKVQYPVCDMWDVHPYSGEWLVDVDAPERVVRQERIAAARPTPDAWWRDVPVLNGIMDSVSGGLEGSIRTSLNKCK